MLAFSLARRWVCLSYEYAWPFIKCTYRIYSMLLSYVIVRQLPTQDSVTWVNTLWNEVTTMMPP
jgi:hypothetical protein